MKRVVFHEIRKTLLFTAVSLIASLIALIYYLQTTETKTQLGTLKAKEANVSATLKTVEADLNKLRAVDQNVRNNALQKEIEDIQKTYKDTVIAYELLVKLKEDTNKTDEYDKQFTKILTYLSEKNYSSASADLVLLKGGISKKQQEIASSFAIPANVAVSNAAPGSGYSRQSVQSDVGTFLVDIIAADLSSTRVIVDTASDGSCGNDCPVLALGDYAGRSGAFAGINGPYFCPASYPSCAGKTNSFDTLIMNKNKVYFNSENNVYSNVPAVIFSGNSARFVGQSLEWGRDTGVDAVIAAQPMLLSGGNVSYGGDDEIKRAGKGSRSFIGTKGNTVYIGVVHNANVAEVARVLKTLGLEYALNLDSGGSTALMSGGRYLVGPGRNTPFGILFVRK